MKVQYGWVMVAIGALMGCVAVGAMMSLAVFLQPITQATSWIFDTFGSFAWLYIGSFAIGLGTAAIALAFPMPLLRPTALRPA